MTMARPEYALKSLAEELVTTTFALDRTRSDIDMVEKNWRELRELEASYEKRVRELKDEITQAIDLLPFNHYPGLIPTPVDPRSTPSDRARNHRKT